MAEQEMSMNEILASIRETLSEELEGKKEPDKLDDDLDDVFVLTPEMRCDEIKISLEERMHRVLEKMTTQSTELKKRTVSEELYPLLKEWMVRMRPDLSDDSINLELNKILPKNGKKEDNDGE